MSEPVAPFGQLLRRRRLERRLSLRVAAGLFAVTPEYLGEVEHAIRLPPTMPEVLRWARALQLTDAQIDQLVVASCSARLLRP